MNKTTIGLAVWFVGSLVMLVMGGFMLYQLDHTPHHLHYEGNLVFQTDQEYQTFKQAVIHKDVLDWDLEVATSLPPILVRFSVDTELNHKFPYGEPRAVMMSKMGESREVGACALLGIGIAMTIFSAIACFTFAESPKGGI